MATGAVPVRIRTATHFSLENSHRETSHRGRTFRSPWAFVISSLTLKLVWCKNLKTMNSVQKSSQIKNFCTEFLHFARSAKMRAFYMVKSHIFVFFKLEIVSKRRRQSYFQNFFFLPSFGSLLSPSPLSVVFFTAFRESPVSASNCFNSSFASGFSLSGVCTTSVT